MTSDRWVRRFAPAPEPTARLVCLPHAGGSASAFYQLAQALAPNIEVLAIQYPGRQDRHAEPLVDDLERLAAAVERAIRSWVGPPLAFFGHSMGATVAFETITRLQRAGCEPLGLLASAAKAPSRGGDAVHTLSDAALLVELEILGGEPTTPIAAEILRASLPVIRNDYRALETYATRIGTLNCPVAALLGDRDPRVTEADAQAWRHHTTGPFTYRRLAGGHFFTASQQPLLVTTLTDLVAAWRSEVRP